MNYVLVYILVSVTVSFGETLSLPDAFFFQGNRCCKRFDDCPVLLKKKKKNYFQLEVASCASYSSSIVGKDRRDLGACWLPHQFQVQWQTVSREEGREIKETLSFLASAYVSMGMRIHTSECIYNTCLPPSLFQKHWSPLGKEGACLFPWKYRLGCKLENHVFWKQKKALTSS